MLRSLFHLWLQNAAKAKMREAIAQTARQQLENAAATTPPPADDAPKTCHWGVVFALGIESGGFEDLLQGAITIQGHGFGVREGGLHGRRVVLTLAGPGQKNARRATEILIDGHHPRRVVSAGFAGALCTKLKRNDILIADQLLKQDESSSDRPCRIAVDVPRGLASATARPGVHRGGLLTVDRVVRSPKQRKELFDRTGALAVDMETFAVAEACAARQTAFSSVRVINDLADETLPRDVEHLLSQKPGAAQWGAALGAMWRRPASAKDFYQLRENALVASDRLAKFLADWVFEK